MRNKVYETSILITPTLTLSRRKGKGNLRFQTPGPLVRFEHGLVELLLIDRKRHVVNASFPSRRCASTLPRRGDLPRSRVPGLSGSKAAPAGRRKGGERFSSFSFFSRHNCTTTPKETISPWRFWWTWGRTVSPYSRAWATAMRNFEPPKPPMIAVRRILFSTILSTAGEFRLGLHVLPGLQAQPGEAIP